MKASNELTPWNGCNNPDAALRFVLFLVVHVTLTLLVPRSFVAMLTGGPTIENEKAAAGTQPVSG